MALTSGRAGGREDGSCRSSSGFELDQLRARIESELVDQHRPRPLDRAKSLRLPSGLVQRRGEQGPAPLAERAPRATSVRACSSTACDVPGGDLGLHPQLLGVHPQALETPGLHPARLPLLEIGQRRPTPQVQRVLRQVRRARRVAGGQGLPRPFEEPLEQPVVQLVVVQRQAVAGRPRLDGSRTEPLPQPDDAALHHLGPRRRRGRRPTARPPERSVRDRVAGAHHQRRQDDPVPGAESVRLALDLERAEHGDTHASTVDLASGRVNAAVTGLTPLRRRADTAPVENGVSALTPVRGAHHDQTPLLLPVALGAIAVLLGACSGTDATIEHRRHDSHAVVPHNARRPTNRSTSCRSPRAPSWSRERTRAGAPLRRRSDAGHRRRARGLPGLLGGWPVIGSDDGDMAFWGKVTQVDTDPCLGGKHVGAGTSVHDLAAAPGRPAAHEDLATRAGDHRRLPRALPEADRARRHRSLPTRERHHLTPAGGTWLQSDVPNATFHEWILNVRRQARRRRDADRFRTPPTRPSSSTWSSPPRSASPTSRSGRDVVHAHRTWLASLVAVVAAFLTACADPRGRHSSRRRQPGLPRGLAR